jgi:Tfp pilus assembly protein PilN
VPFFGGQTSTYLIITESQVMRADVRGEQLVKLTKEDRPVGTTLPIAVELAAGLTGKKPTQKTYVIADDFWTGVVDLDERSIYGLEGEDLEQMLRFETESLSNLDPTTSRLGFVELSSVPPDTRRFWGAAVPSEILSGVAQAVRVRGGKLELLANPIGLSSPDRSGVPWVEFTSVLAGAFAAPAESGALPRAYVTRRSPTSDRWYEALGTLFGGKMPDMGWQTTPDARPPAYTGSLESLSDELVLERWISGVIARSANPSGFPCIAAPQAPTSAKTVAGIGVAAAMITALTCGTLTWIMSSRLSSMRAETARLEEPAAEKKRLNAGIKKTKSEIDELVVEAKEATTKQQNLRLLVDQSDRFAILLQALADQCLPSIVLDEISPGSKGITLSGRAIQNDAVTSLAQQLEPIAIQVGWSVRPPSVTGLNQTTAGGPWSFTIELVEQIPEANQKSKTVLTSVRKSSSALPEHRGDN